MPARRWAASAAAADGPAAAQDRRWARDLEVLDREAIDHLWLADDPICNDPRWEILIVPDPARVPIFPRDQVGADSHRQVDDLAAPDQVTQASPTGLPCGRRATAFRPVRRRPEEELAEAIDLIWEIQVSPIDRVLISLATDHP